ncbi:glucose-6-phosphate isomerase [Colwelliaceae bacterium 6471]
MHVFDDLTAISKQAKNRSILGLFSDANRVHDFSLSAADFFLDYSKQNITEEEFTFLMNMAENAGLEEKIKAMFSGERINNTENRGVLHTLLRAPNAEKYRVLGEKATEVIETERHMQSIVAGVHSGQLLSASSKKYTDVLAIGIGGSYYGIKVGLSALKPFQVNNFNVHIVANVDGDALVEKLNLLDAETTLVVVISKTFTTQETLLNASAVKEWMLKSSSAKQAIAQQWFAVSSNVEKATAFGIGKNNILPMWDWVGGRFSLWSAVGLPLALAIGNENFQCLKQGAYEVDVHFQTAPFDKNMPVIMAMIGIWNRNGLQYPSLAILPYAHSLRALPGYLQQTDMESNGKSVSINGEKLPWLTAPIVFGQEGTNSQHAFMQLMHQSDDIIPTDFIIALNGSSGYTEHHKVLVANCFAQSEALMQGKSLAQVERELEQSGLSSAEVAKLAPHKTMKGNTPSNTLVLQSLTPKAFGALLALYEHKVFVQGVIWQLNSFDQWGVELGKELGQKILQSMSHSQHENLSASTKLLINKFLAGSA